MRRSVKTLFAAAAILALVSVLASICGGQACSSRLTRKLYCGSGCVEGCRVTLACDLQQHRALLCQRVRRAAWECVSPSRFELVRNSTPRC